MRREKAIVSKFFYLYYNIEINKNKFLYRYCFCYLLKSNNSRSLKCGVKKHCKQAFSLVLKKVQPPDCTSFLIKVKNKTNTFYVFVLLW